MQNWSEQTLRNLLESLPDALVVIGSRGAIALVNEQTERLFGYKREELLGRPIEILIPERFRRDHVGLRDGYFVMPRSRAMGAKRELFGRRKDGTEFPVEISLSPLQTEQGPLATSVIRDISQRKRDEAKFRTLVENIPAVTFIAPLDESIPELYVSPQIEKLLGFSQKEWLEDPVLWYRQLHPQDRERWNCQFAPTCASGEAFRVGCIGSSPRTVGPSGSTARPAWCATRTARRRSCKAWHLTSPRSRRRRRRCEAQESLRRNNLELERRVAEQTEALAHSMTELQEKAGELENYADVTSRHDLKTPLGTTLTMWLEKLLPRSTWVRSIPRPTSGSIPPVPPTRNGWKAAHQENAGVLADGAAARYRKPQPVDCAAIAHRAA